MRKDGAVLKKELLIFILAFALKIIILGALLWSANFSFNELTGFSDVRSYLKIAESYPLPYSLEGMQVNARHYPLFPFFVWIISPVFAGNIVYAGFFTAILISSLCCVVLYLIAKQFTQQAFLISLIFAVLPDKWAQVSVYPLSEAVFVLFLLAAVYYHLKGNFSGAYLALALLLLARPLGAIFLASFLLIDIIVEKRFFIIKYAILASIPFLIFHGYLFTVFDKLMLFTHAEKGGDWGGAVFSYPLSGLIAGMIDPDLLPARKIYTLAVFLCYLAVFAVACYHFFNTKKYQLFSALIIPYFIFTLFLKGGNQNWWMLSLPRFLIPLAPFGFIFLFGQLKEKYLYAILGGGTVMAIAYTVGSRILHALHSGAI
jgi:hypothetical protein